MQKIIISISLPENVVEAIDKIAEEEAETRSCIIRRILKEWMNEQ